MGTARSVSASWLLRVSRPGTPLSYRPHTRTPSPAPAPARQPTHPYALARARARASDEKKA